MGFLFALLFIWLPCAFYASHVAADKGHNGAAWFFGGFLFGPIALAAAVGLGDQKLRRYIRLMAENQGVPKEAFGPATQTPETSEPTDLYPKLK